MIITQMSTLESVPAAPRPGTSNNNDFNSSPVGADKEPK